MDVFNLLSYINKISLFAFFITTVVVVYQIYILKKEKTKEQTPSIPDFKENHNLGVVANFTSLPDSLTKKELKSVNYSKLVFLIISLLTIIIVIFVVSLINKNNSSRNQALVTPQVKIPSPSSRVILSPSPTLTLIPTVSPTVALSPTVVLSPTIVPTEIILAQAPSSTPILDPTTGQTITNSAPTVLPETGSWEKGLFIIGVAISTIFFSFWF
ncbi:MAG: hypothetical protein AAB859_00910 [Patescibacteria group bacterium]